MTRLQEAEALLREWVRCWLNRTSVPLGETSDFLAASPLPLQREPHNFNECGREDCDLCADCGAAKPPSTVEEAPERDAYQELVDATTMLLPKPCDHQ